MNSIEKAKEKALSLVGQGYIYGAKGQTCSLKFRQGQAAQYPEQADMILGTGAKWDGKPVWDCAQFTRAVAREGGVTLVSGATSQWTKTDWLERGEIDTLPVGEFVFLYRRQTGSSTTMSHTGVAVGDGTCIHARGTAYGVVRQKMSEYNWTHWAKPKWPDEQEQKETDEMQVLYKATVYAKSGKTVNLRREPNGDIFDRVPINTIVDVYEEMDGWLKIGYNGNIGYMDADFLKTDEEPDDSFKTLVLSKLDEILNKLT